MESALSTVTQWFSQSHMQLNAAKSQLLVLGTVPQNSSKHTESNYQNRTPWFMSERSRIEGSEPGL